MTTVKKNIIRFITLLVAIQLLNLSIYAQNFKPLCCLGKETNITEYVIEAVLGHDNAIPEQSQHRKELPFHKHIIFKAISISPEYPLPGLQQQNVASAVPLQELYLYLYFREINPPPPKA